MSSGRGQYNEEIHDEAAGPYDERTEGERTDQRGIPYFPSSSLRGLWPSLRRRRRGGGTEPIADDEEQYEKRADEEGRSGRGGLSSYWDEGLISLLIIGGAALFLFPEPATSALGILLMGVGVVAWAIDWAT